MILILRQFGYESLFYLRLALLESIFCSYAGFVGGVAEWLNAPVLKTDVGESLPWVRIPPPPPPHSAHSCFWYFWHYSCARSGIYNSALRLMPHITSHISDNFR